MDAGHRAILFKDIIGSTEMTARLGDCMLAELVRAYDALVRACLGRRSGREALPRRSTQDVFPTRREVELISVANGHPAAK